jgi:hypothetical protein
MITSNFTGIFVKEVIYARLSYCDRKTEEERMKECVKKDKKKQIIKWQDGR